MLFNIIWLCLHIVTVKNNNGNKLCQCLFVQILFGINITLNKKEDVRTSWRKLIDIAKPREIGF